jgi:predicted alpha-1,2-mannosidase
MRLFLFVLFLINLSLAQESEKLISYVNPFVGSSNFGTTNPGPIAPRGMVSVSPFNVSGAKNLPMEKDSRWLSTPYVHENNFLTGFSHVNLSGVGCPDLGVLIAMPTTGALETDPAKYGSTYRDEKASVGYYETYLDTYDVNVATTATTRVGISRYSFPAGKANVLLNLGLGLTNEQGARVKRVSDTEIEGMRQVGSFCYYKPEEAYPIYFVAQVSIPTKDQGIWKKPSTYVGEEAQWMGYNAKTRLMKGYHQEVVGDSIGAYFSYDFNKATELELRIGVSYVSIENARDNLRLESEGRSFEAIKSATQEAWEKLLAVVRVKGGKPGAKEIFYTALYHTQIHPNTLNDANGDYPAMGTRETLNTVDTRYTVFSLWDTHRNLHPLLSLLYPKQQSNMVKSMLNIYSESGWLPKWELNATETTTMVGDPAGIIIADTYHRGIRDFNVALGFEAMKKSATQLHHNPLRPELSTYIEKGYLGADQHESGSVSIVQEYNLADFAIATLAKTLGDIDSYETFLERSHSYRKLFDPSFNLLRPKNSSGTWLSPFNPDTGANFVKNPGYIEGNAWQYTFMVPHDIEGLIDLMGGGKSFVSQLDKVFDNNQFDMANEPDIAYPYLYNFVKGAEWKTQKQVRRLLDTYYHNKPDGLPGNDDTGTMSAWAVFSMLGIYPVTPGLPLYAITAPSFESIEIQLDSNYYPDQKLLIRSNSPERNAFIKSIQLDGNEFEKSFITHEQLINSKEVKFILHQKPVK